MSSRATRPARNAPCWCGSGRKYKRCHAAREGTDEGKGSTWIALGTALVGPVLGFAVIALTGNLGLGIFSGAVFVLLGLVGLLRSRIPPDRRGRLVGRHHARIDPLKKHLDED